MKRVALYGPDFDCITLGVPLLGFAVVGLGCNRVRNEGSMRPLNALEFSNVAIALVGRSSQSEWHKILFYNNVSAMSEVKSRDIRFLDTMVHTE